MLGRRGWVAAARGRCAWRQGDGYVRAGGWDWVASLNTRVMAVRDRWVCEGQQRGEGASWGRAGAGWRRRETDVFGGRGTCMLGQGWDWVATVNARVMAVRDR